MRLLKGLTNLGYQRLSVSTDDGPLILTLRYHPTQYYWYMDVEWKDFVLRGRKVVCHPNLLYPWKKLLPFGLTCLTRDGTDPRSLDAFTKYETSLYLADEEDKVALEPVKI